MPVAFFKTVNGNKRWRIVKSGQNADNLSLSIDNVVFDSDYDNIWSVYTSGVIPLASAPADGAKIVSWPNPGYVPMILAMATGDPDSTNATLFGNIIATYSNGALFIPAAKADGLYLYGGSTYNYPLNVWYVAFRAAS